MMRLLFPSCWALLLVPLTAFSPPTSTTGGIDVPAVITARKSRPFPAVPLQTTTSSDSEDVIQVDIDEPELSKYPLHKAIPVKLGMITFIASMCVALPLTLTPISLAHKLKLLDKPRKEHYSLRTGAFCARWLLRIIPFCHMETISEQQTCSSSEPAQPAVWVCNHTSMLDVFLLMAADKKLRGKHKRPIKIVYWKDLEDNPITKLLFRQSGFLPVQMAANEPGQDNAYDKSSFKTLLKDSKTAFNEGFDLGILPEGQLNPHPEEGLLPIFTGAFTLAKLSRRPVHFMALHGAHRLWHPVHGMKIQDRHVKIRTYQGRVYHSADDFTQTFETVVGHFGTHGQDLPDEELQKWLTGEAYQEIMQREEQQQRSKEEETATTSDSSAQTQPQE